MRTSVIGTAPVSVVSGRALVPGLLLALGVGGLSCATASTSNGTDLAAAPAARLLFFPGDEPASGERLVGGLRAILQETGDEAELAVLAPREHPYEVGRFAVRTLPALLLVVGEEVLLRRSGNSLEDLEPWRQRVWVEAVRRGTLDAESFGTLDLELRRNLAWELLDLGRYAEAADHLAWLWRNGCRIDPAFELRRAVSLPGDLERLCASWPEGRSRVTALLAEEFERVEAGGRLWHLGSLARVLRSPEPLVAWAFRPEGREVLKRVRPEELWNLYQALADLGALREAGRLLPDAGMALRAVDGEAERFRVQGEAAAAWTLLAWELGRLHAGLLLAERPQEAEAVAAYVLEALGEEAGEALLLGSARSHGVPDCRLGILPVGASRRAGRPRQLGADPRAARHRPGPVHPARPGPHRPDPVLRRDRARHRARGPRRDLPARRDPRVVGAVRGGAPRVEPPQPPARSRRVAARGLTIHAAG